MIASEHPLLIFKDLVSLDDNRTDELGLETLLSRGRTHDFEKLPQVLWATTGLPIPNPECFERLRRARNAIQHFCAPDIPDLSALSLEFIYTIIDPLIAERFGLLLTTDAIGLLRIDKSNPAWSPSKSIAASATTPLLNSPVPAMA